MIVIINGPCGIGKTSVAWELVSHFECAVMLDGDYIGAVHPFEIYDEARVAYLYRTIHHLVAYHIEQGGYHDFVINYVFETPESLAALRLLLLSGLDSITHAYRLIASDDAIEARIRQREQESDADLRWHLKRYKELVTIQDAAAKRGDVGFAIDTTDRTAAEVADAIWEDIHEAVEVVDYDPTWPDQFEAERARIAAALGDLALEIHHVGSTAIPGIDAKPIIDTMVVVRRLDDAVACIAPMQELDYAFIDYPENTDRRFFRKGKPRTHHLHIVEEGSRSLIEHLAFRDALRADAGLRREYQELKHALRAKYKHDRATYSESKGAFVKKVLDGRRV
ncbi:MAG: GrpB family protein [Anaerolineae bacterium]|nr:GrpB family protein [Anaerolineae bacterium]